MGRPRVLIASDSFKGSLSSAEVADVVASELLACVPGATADRLCVADGGEGTLDAIVASTGARRMRAEVAGPLGERVRAEWCLTPDGRAFLEAASANGLTLVPEDRRDVMRASTAGVGQLLLAALDAGARDVTIGVGGSATNDGGAGMLRALGARLTDADGLDLEGRACDLARVANVDASLLDGRLSRVALHVMCDVSNPLLGPTGATATFGPQKGAGPDQLAELERGMSNFARRSAEELGLDASAVSGTGAAGGLAFALHAYLGAELLPGIDCVLDLVGFDEALAAADLCITGEGHLDAQTAGGKVVAGVARRCGAAGKPCVAIVGGADARAVEAGLPGLVAAVPTVGEACPVEEAMANAELNLRLAARRTFALLATGAELGRAAGE